MNSEKRKIFGTIFTLTRFARKTSFLILSSLRSQILPSVIPLSLWLSRALRFRYASLRDGLRPLLTAAKIEIVGLPDAKDEKDVLSVFSKSKGFFLQTWSGVLALKSRCRRQRVSAPRNFFTKASSDMPIHILPPFFTNGVPHHSR